MEHGEELLAESIVENALKTDVASWVKSIYLQTLLKKKTMTVQQDNSAVEELSTLYPNLDREEMDSLTGEVVSKVSILIFLQPERYRLTWRTLCNFMILLADNLKESHSNDEDTVKHAANRAFKVATRVFEAGNPAPDPYDIVEDNALNIAIMQLKFLQRTSATYAGAARGMFQCVTSMPGQFLRE
ncbi:hypothetical protein LZ31DRAFT_600624 [Colletotrichum somersetense]|nr:hypothetical protein LZ31DRAFT_600624 [Colletotrichum somersetense]